MEVATAPLGVGATPQFPGPGHPNPAARSPKTPADQNAADPSSTLVPDHPLPACPRGEEGGADRLPQPIKSAGSWSDPRRGSPLVATRVSAHRTFATRANR